VGFRETRQKWDSSFNKLDSRFEVTQLVFDNPQEMSGIAVPGRGDENLPVAFCRIFQTTALVAFNSPSN
jgi:hypothetical protein